jgi:predicted site-specific integrase-resolvase
MVAPISLKEFSDRAGIDIQTTKRWIRDGKLPVIRLSPRIIRIPGAVAEQILTEGFSLGGERTTR